MMQFLKPNFKTAAIITALIFAQKIYRHPSDFSFIFNEGLTTTVFGILGWGCCIWWCLCFCFSSTSLLK